MWIWVFWGLIGGLMLIGVVETIREKLTGRGSRRRIDHSLGFRGDGGDSDIERARAHGSSWGSGGWGSGGGWSSGA